MHHALLVPELFDLVCLFSTRGTLSCLARTCRSFEAIALGVLWEELNFVHLVSLWPKSIWSERHERGGTVFEFSRPPSLEDWQRMRTYTCRVVKIYFTNIPGYWPSPYYLRLMISVRPPDVVSPIFPRLKEIRALTKGESNFTIPMFKFPWVHGPSITRFGMHLCDIEVNEQMRTFLGSLGTLYPNLRGVSFESFDVECTAWRQVLTKNICQAILGWKHLVHASFNAADLNDAAYEHLARLESLTSLSLRVLSDPMRELRRDSLPSTPFPAITELQLVAPNIDGVVEGIGDQYRSLSVFKVRNLCETAPDIYAFCISVASHFDHSTLHTISLRNHSFRQKVPVPLSSLRPLFAFTQLRTVILSPFGSILINDDELRQLAFAWPFGQVLDLTRDVRRGTFEHSAPILPTFRGLFSLLYKCPQLRELSINIDTRDSTWIDSHNLPHGVCNRAMSKLTLGPSLVDDPDRVAVILRALFPILDRVETDKHIDGWITGEGWRETKDERTLAIWDAVNARLTDSRSNYNQ